MKKTILTTAFGVLLTLSGISATSAQVYYSYNNNAGYTNTPCTGVYPNYCTGYIPSSYYYTSGCNQYYHDGYTNTERFVRNTCQTQPTYTYTQPVTYTHYTQPTTYTSYNSYSASPYYTYGYNRSTGSWYPGYTDTNIYSLFGNTNYYNNNYNNGVVYTPTTNCYYVSGVYSCF